MTNYISDDELRDYIGSDTTNWQSVISSAATVASRTIETMAGRVFLDSGSVSVRYFTPADPWCVYVDDFSTLTGLVVAIDTNYDNTFGTTLTVNTDFIAQPRNQLRDGQAWPYTELEAVGTSQWFPPPSRGRRETVKVTARWGWASVPDAVKQACLVAAARIFKLKDAPDGFVGMDGWGPVKIRENPEVRALLGPYMYSPVTAI